MKLGATSLAICLFNVYFLAGSNALAAEKKAPPAKEGVKVGRSERMDFGPFISYTLMKHAAAGGADKVNPAHKSPAASEKESLLALKGISIRLGQPIEAAVCFDTDLMRFAAGWKDGFVDLSKTNEGDHKGSTPAVQQGTLSFSTRAVPGWGKGDDFTDPRPKGLGPLPAAWAKYKGLYLNGKNVLLSYTVGICDVLEMPGIESSGPMPSFSRTIHLSVSTTALTLLICDGDGAAGGIFAPGAGGGAAKKGSAAKSIAVLHAEEETAAGVVNAPAGASLEIVNENRILLKLPPITAPVTFKVVIWNGSHENLPKFTDVLKGATALPNLPEMCKGGPARWTEPVITSGTLGVDDGPYAVDTITIPETNPWNSWMRPSAFDFFSDGRAAVSTLSGDVWIVSGIDASLNKLVWKRFATGLFEPLGLKIVNDAVYVLGRDQITRLHDFNNDGEADYYENFNNLGNVSPSYHAFAFDLQTDREGNFYYVNDGNQVEIGLPQHGCLFKIPRDGNGLEVLASGLRAPNGMAIGPNDEISCSDNQGHWTPSSKINLMKKGGFYGYVGDPRKVDAAHPVHPPASFDPPLCWIPMAQDNSSGGQVWVSGDKWGPFKNHMLHMSYGSCSLFHVLMEDVDGTAQGGVVKFPLKFPSGIMRARFNARDGQLYVCGLNGWQSNATKDGTFNRVRYTGKPVHMPCAMRVTPQGLEITFTCSLDPATAADAQSYGISQWNYHWTSAYGSDDYSANTGQKGRDTVSVTGARLSTDGKTVMLQIPGLKPVMQMGIKLNIKAADGAPINTEIDYTINKLRR